MEGTCRDLCATPLFKQTHLAQVAQDHVQVVFEYLQGWRAHSFSGQPEAVLHRPRSEEVLPDVQTEPLVRLIGLVRFLETLLPTLVT